VTDLAPILQGFFTDRLARQRKASPHTVTAYRDACRLLLAFAQEQTGKAPSRLSLADLDATLIGAFLHHLEDKRGNGSATRNAGWPPSTPCSATPPPGHPSTPP
jgi:integrase/recombinase XerD